MVIFFKLKPDFQNKNKLKIIESKLNIQAHFLNSIRAFSSKYKVLKMLSDFDLSEFFLRFFENIDFGGQF